MLAEGAWQHNEQIDLVVNPDYDGPRKAKNGGVTFSLLERRTPPTPTCWVTTSTSCDRSRTSALQTFKDELGDRSINQAVRRLPVVHDPGLPPALRAAKRASCVAQAISMAINRDEITDVIFDGTRSRPTTSRRRSSTATRRRARVRGPELQRRRGQGQVGRGRRHLAVGRTPSRSPTTPTAATRRGSTPSRTASRTFSASTPPASRTRPSRRFAPRHRPHARPALPHRMAGRLPALFNFLGPIYGTGAGSNDGDYSNPSSTATAEGRSRPRSPTATRP